nr:helix-turn-helix domain-containing protein [Nocardioides sp. MAH-18]
MGLVAAAYLSAFVDARTPLLVADHQGIRLRLGRTWRGVPWDSLDCVEVQARRGLLRDGRVVILLDDPDALLADLDRAGRRQAAIARRLHGSPLAVPLSLSTWVTGGDADLPEALLALAGDPERVVELVDELDEPDDEPGDEPSDELDEPLDEPAEHPHPVLHDPRPTLARGIDYLAERLRLHPDPEPDRAPEPEVTIASATPLPLRDAVEGTRVEAVYRAPEPTQPIAEVAPLIIEEPVFEEPVFEEPVFEPVADPVVGPQLAGARTRLGLSVDQLAERTRIRPHVIESIEVDDFAPCGGDFYARGHLRTLARVLGVDAAPLLASYDELYADAPLDARRVFEAELATGAQGPIRSTKGGPNWSVLIAAVMALVLAWSIARLLMDSPVHVSGDQPVLNGSPSGQRKLGAPVPVLLNAAAGGAHVVVKDGAGEVVFNGDLAFGEQKSIEAAPPVHVQSSDGALVVSVDGEDRGALGAEGAPAQNTYAAAK